MEQLISSSAATLLQGLLDYAGLFPPAELDMRSAVMEYARQRRSPQRFMLGLFVVPRSRLGEFQSAADTLASSGDPWRLSVLLGRDSAPEAAQLPTLEKSLERRGRVHAVEIKAGTAAEIDQALEALPRGITVYVEVPLLEDLAPLLGRLRRHGARAKVRTGGVTADAIPEPGDLARFLVAAAGAKVAFKATAGLHNPVRRAAALTYAPDSPRAVMHGFLNLFAAAALARGGAPLADIEEVIREEDPRAFSFEERSLVVGRRRISTSSLKSMRSGFAVSFGSCSFAEPVAALDAMGIF